MQGGGSAKVMFWEKKDARDAYSKLNGKTWDSNQLVVKILSLGKYIRYFLYYQLVGRKNPTVFPFSLE